MAFTPKNWENLPSETTPINATSLIDLETRLSDYTDDENIAQRATASPNQSAASASVGTSTKLAREDHTHQHFIAPKVTTLSAGSYDGEPVRYKPEGAANSPVWYLIWDSDLNSGSGAWSCVGGGWMYDIIGTLESTASTTFTDLATVGPRVPIAYIGVYEIEWKVINYNSTEGGISYCSPGGTALTPADSYATIHQGYTGSSQASKSNAIVSTLAAGNLDLVYKVGISGTSSFYGRYLMVRPLEIRP